MPYYYEDSDNVRRNRVTIIGEAPGYNCILSADRVAANDVTEPVTLSEVKAHLQIPLSDTSQDTYLTGLIRRCRRALESDKWISIVEQTVTVTLHNELGNITLPYGPVKEVSEAFNSDSETALDAVDYEVKEGVVKTSGINKVVYTAGFEVVPDDIIGELLDLIYYCFENRGNSGSLAEGVQKISRVGKQIPVLP